MFSSWTHAARFAANVDRFWTMPYYERLKAFCDAEWYDGRDRRNPFGTKERLRAAAETYYGEGASGLPTGQPVCVEDALAATFMTNREAGILVASYGRISAIEEFLFTGQTNLDMDGEDVIFTEFFAYFIEKSRVRLGKDPRREGLARRALSLNMMSALTQLVYHHGRPN